MSAWELRSEDVLRLADRPLSRSGSTPKNDLIVGAGMAELAAEDALPRDGHEPLIQGGPGRCLEDVAR